MEDAHHLFIACPRFSSLRAQYYQHLHDNIASILHLHALPQEDKSFIYDWVRDLFIDSPIWPSKRSAYYLGILPTLLPPSCVGTCLHIRISHFAHVSSIQLAGRIWGDVRRHSFQSRTHFTSSPIILPSHLNHLFPRYCS